MSFYANCMKCQDLFSEKNKKNILKCLLPKYLPRVLSIKYLQDKNKISVGDSLTEMPIISPSFRTTYGFLGDSSNEMLIISPTLGLNYGLLRR